MFTKHYPVDSGETLVIREASAAYIRCTFSAQPFTLRLPDGQHVDFRIGRWVRWPDEKSLIDAELINDSGEDLDIVLDFCLVGEETGDDAVVFDGVVSTNGAADVFEGTEDSDNTCTAGATTGILAADPKRHKVLIQWPEIAEAPCRVAEDGNASQTYGAYVRPGGELVVEARNGLSIFNFGAEDVDAIISIERDE